MKKIFNIIVLMLFATLAGAQNVKSYSSKDLMKRASNKDTIYILNFWATWCAPCVKELPVFNELEKRYEHKPVKVILMSFDFKEAFPLTIVQFIKSKGLQPEVVWMNETNADIFIPNIDEGWHGALPATIVIDPVHKFKRLWEGIVTEKPVAAVVDAQLSLKK